MSTDFSSLSDVHELNSNGLFSNHQAVHFFNCYLSLLGVLVLNESEAFAHTCLWITMDIHILDLAERLKELLQLGFLDLRKFIC